MRLCHVEGLILHAGGFSNDALHCFVDLRA